MQINTDKHKEAFKEEARELLAELESSLLELEERPEDTDLIARVFRAMHTIKGSDSMFKFDEVASFTHEVETVFDQVREGAIPVTKQLIDLTLGARDHIRLLVEDSGAAVTNKTQADSIIASLRRLNPASASQNKEARTAAPANTQLPPDEEASGTYRIHFRPPADIALRGIDPLGLLDELRDLGDCTIQANTIRIPSLDQLNAELCALSWDIIITTTKGLNAIRDVFLFIQDDSDLKIDRIEYPAGADDTTPKKLGDILLDRGVVTPEVVQKGLSSQKRFGEVLVEMGAVGTDAIQSALAEQQHLKSLQEKRQSIDAAASIRVPSEKLDRLVDLVGELVTLQSLLSQTAVKFKKTKIPSIAESVARLTAELRDITMGIRMLPIGTTFSKFKRLVRDLSKELGKEIELTTDGAETELDKTVIEKLGDPLVHILRNSLDHGIEAPAIRSSAGKPTVGTIHLSARHAGANVVVQIQDDGKGLDAELLRQKGLEKGLIAPDSRLTEKELFALILAPGFSTAQKVTSVSGRGVGMDVVKRAIDSLRGAIEIESRKGLGTTITLKLPLTLAIIEGLLVKIGAESFIMPLSLVEECVELTRKDIEKANGRDLAYVRGKVVPYIRLRKQFKIDGERPAIEQIVIVSIDGRRTGFVVDRVIGGHQTVLKNLGNIYRDIPGISGATILGDGTVALILDLPGITEKAAVTEVQAANALEMDEAQAYRSPP